MVVISLVILGAVLLFAGIVVGYLIGKFHNPKLGPMVLTMKIDDPEVFAMIKKKFESGELAGVSIGGLAKPRDVLPKPDPRGSSGLFIGLRS